jgi:hypothetical protein
MLAAQAKKQEGWLRAIIPRHRPLVAACTIVLPRLEILRKNAVFRSNEATARDVTVLAESVRSDLVFTSKVVQQRRVCGSTRLLESDGRHLQPTDTETYLYVFSGEEGAVDWYVVEAGHHRRPVPDDRRIVDNEQHLADWLDRLEQRILP